jgi:hypothetical protein
MRVVGALKLLLIFLAFSLSVQAQANSNTPPMDPAFLQSQYAYCNSKLAAWRSDATWGMYAALAVGVLGITIGVLQTSNRKGCKLATVGLGTTISVITLLVQVILVTDYKTYRRAADTAEPYVVAMSGALEDYSKADPALQQELYSIFASNMNGFTGVAKNVVDENVSPINSQSAEVSHTGEETASIASFAFSTPVYAGQASPPLPAWTGTNGTAGGAGYYFVGKGANQNLTTARNLAIQDAINSAYKSGQRTSNRYTLPQFANEVQHNSAVSFTNDFQYFDSSHGVFWDYVRVLVPLSLLR